MLMRSVGLSDEQRLLVETTRAFVDDRVLLLVDRHEGAAAVDAGDAPLQLHGRRP